MLRSLSCLLLAGPSAMPQDPTPIQQRVAAMTRQIRPLELRTTVADLVALGTRHTGGPGKEKALAYLEKRVAALAERSKGRLTWRREEQEVLATRLGRKIPIVNLICRLEGKSDPERIYVLGGHFDSINSDVGDAEGAAPGANDDGSGTAAVLEALRVMCDQEFAATIEFCFFDAEEMGLLGSTVHAEALAKKEAFVDGMITNDIVGNTLGMDGKKNDRYLRCFSYAPRGNDSPGRSFARAATWATRTHVPGFELKLIFRGDRFGRGGDHKPFANAGWPALRFTEAAEDFSRQHQTPRERDGKSYGDTVELVDFEYLVRVVAVDVATLAEVASAPRAPTRAQVAGSRTSYETNLTWEGPQLQGVGAGSYEAVWRETTAPDWQQARPLAARGRAVLPVSVDDHVIGVRSVGADGSRSRATTPAEPDATEQRPTSRPTSREGGRRR